MAELPTCFLSALAFLGCNCPQKTKTTPSSLTLQTLVVRAATPFLRHLAVLGKEKPRQILGFTGFFVSERRIGDSNSPYRLYLEGI